MLPSKHTFFVSRSTVEFSGSSFFFSFPPAPELLDPPSPSSPQSLSVWLRVYPSHPFQQNAAHSPLPPHSAIRGVHDPNFLAFEILEVL